MVMTAGITFSTRDDQSTASWAVAKEAINAIPTSNQRRIVIASFRWKKFWQVFQNQRYR
jgi:hypothetical protein